MTESAESQQPRSRNWARFVLRFLLAFFVAAGLILLGRSLQPSSPAAEISLEPTLRALSTELAQARDVGATIEVTEATQQPEIIANQSSLPASDQIVAFTSFGAGFQQLRLTVPGSLTSIALTTGPFDDADPALSPDGQQLAFRSNRDGNWELYTLELATGQVRRLTNTPGYEGKPSWSPDGRWLVYEAYKDGDMDIWILPLEQGKTPIQLTNHPGMDLSPSWDPASGRQIAFISTRDGSADLFLANLDAPTDRFVNLTRTPDWNEKSPAFSPDGNQIAYATDNDGLELTWTMTLGDSNLPQQIGTGSNPEWEPDGKGIAVLQSDPHQQRTVVYSFEGQNPPLGLIRSGPPIQLSWQKGASGEVVTAEGEQPEPLALLPTTDSSAGLGRRSLIDLDSVGSIDASLIETARGPFEQLRSAIAARVGWDFLGSLEAAYVGLNDPLPPGFAYNDWLYTGRAFAFESSALDAGRVEIVPEEFGGRRYWRVYIRTSKQDGTQGAPLREHPWDFQARYSGDPSDYDQGGQLMDEIPAGYYVDFTAVAEAFGFERQPALTNWRTFYPGARFNEFAYTEGLDWRTAMLQLYPPEAVATPTAFSSPTATPTNTPWPTPTPWWLRWRTSTPTPSATPVPPTATSTSTP
ncbi:MAG: TolB family protein [Anaerolineales bacterium]